MVDTRKLTRLATYLQGQRATHRIRQRAVSSSSREIDKIKYADEQSIIDEIDTHLATVEALLNRS